MDEKREDIPRLNLMLAGLLHYGTWIAFAVTAMGLIFSQLRFAAVSDISIALDKLHLLTAGIALFILLPVMRVALMLAVFLRQRDHRFTVIALIVLATILAGFSLEARHAIFH